MDARGVVKAEGRYRKEAGSAICSDRWSRGGVVGGIGLAVLSSKWSFTDAAVLSLNTGMQVPGAVEEPGSEILADSRARQVNAVLPQTDRSSPWRLRADVGFPGGPLESLQRCCGGPEQGKTAAWRKLEGGDVGQSDREFKEGDGKLSRWRRALGVRRARLQEKRF